MWQDLARVLALLITKYQKLQELNKEKHGVLVLMTKTIRKDEIRRLPKGEKLVKILDRFVK